MSNTALTPLDATDYFFAPPLASVGTTIGNRKMYIPKSGFIRLAHLICSAGTVGTDEAWTWVIRKNDTTDYSFAMTGVASALRVWTNNNLAIPVNAGDFITFKTTTPTWVTNPDVCVFYGVIQVET